MEVTERRRAYLEWLREHNPYWSETLKPVKRDAQLKSDRELADNFDRYLVVQGVSVRVRNAIRNSEITSLEQLGALEKNELLRIPNFGRESLREVEILLGRYIETGPKPSLRVFSDEELLAELRRRLAKPV